MKLVWFNRRNREEVTGHSMNQREEREEEERKKETGVALIQRLIVGGQDDRVVGGPAHADDEPLVLEWTAIVHVADEQAYRPGPRRLVVVVLAPDDKSLDKCGARFFLLPRVSSLMFFLLRLLSPYFVQSSTETPF